MLVYLSEAQISQYALDIAESLVSFQDSYTVDFFDESFALIY